jgi:hypothetical protein
VDARLIKGFSLGHVDATAYLDVRNLFNFRNTVSVFPETGSITNPRNLEQSVSDETARLHNEALANGTPVVNGVVDVHSCASWQRDPVDCVALNRAEARYGNGDGLFTVAEQARAIRAWYDMLNGVQWFYGPPRRLRIGVELSF